MSLFLSIYLPALTAKKMHRPGVSPGGALSREERTLLAIFFGKFAVAAFFYGLELLFAAFGAFGRSFDELGTDQFQNSLLGAVALAPSEANDSCVAAVPLAEPGT